MPAPFQRLSLEEFADLLAHFPFKRQINAVHMHHTWRPNHSQDHGLKSIEGMWQYHTQINGWSDIAQHITISSNGDIWTGRSWNQPPASAAGHNGNREIGPFMLEIIGDFDAGHDCFEGRQRQVALEIIARVQLHFNLPVESLKFHNQMSRKSCPGSIEYDEVLNAVRDVRAWLQDAAAARNPADMPFPLKALAFRHSTEKVVQLLSRGLPEQADPWDAEPDLRSAREIDLTILTGMENPTLPAPVRSISQQNGKRELELSAGMLSELRPHVVNLAQGEFSSSGIFATSPADVDAIFEDYLPRELEVAKANGRTLRVLFYAHGGLTPENNALRAAHEHLLWWRGNHVYPIYFIWETGLLETIGQLLSIAGQQLLGKPDSRGIERDLWDATSDPVIEKLVRNLGCVQIWSGMKRSAERAFQSEGGGLYLAQKLKAFCDRYAADQQHIELHGIGHSAGAIFQSHFVSASHQISVPSFKSMHFLAPAIRVDTFEKLLLDSDLIGQGKGIDHLTIFTMKKDWELADNCVVYRKSLLYLIYYALEPQRQTAILGLEESLRANLKTRSLFGLSGTSAIGEVIWSKSLLTTGRNASTCTEHGMFPANRPTMNSVLLRILNATDNRAIEVEFPEEATRDLESVDFERLAGELKSSINASNNGWAAANAPGQSVFSTPAITASAITPPQNGQVGRRIALCVGIDAYAPPNELFGCVADANLWATVFKRLGFSTTQLLNQQATRSAILDNLGNLVHSSQPGDVIAFQFSGHGTQLPDMSQDEAGGDSPGQDEAICPYDFANGAFVIDDDIAEIFNTIPAGVNVTCFIDCCHSGTISRFAVGTPTQSQTAIQRVRFIQPTAQMVEDHRRFRERIGQSRAGSPGVDLMKEVVFSACLSIEVAYENNGQGDFTRYATQLLQQGIQGLSHEEFERRVIAAFGSNPRQHPRLYCNATMRGGLVLQSNSQTQSSRTVNSLNNDTAALAQGFRMIADLLERK